MKLLGLVLIGIGGGALVLAWMFGGNPLIGAAFILLGILIYVFASQEARASARAAPTPLSHADASDICPFCHRPTMPRGRRCNHCHTRLPADAPRKTP